MQNTVRLRSKVAMATRTYLDTIHGKQWAMICLSILMENGNFQVL